MGHTRLKRKKKGWATQKAQRGGSFNPDAPTKTEQQAIDSFHDFWKMTRGKFDNLNSANPLILDIIKWLLINYCVPALGVIPSRPLLTVAPINNFKFTTYTAKNKFGDLFYSSSIKTSSVEDEGRHYVKIPEAAEWVRTGDNFLNFRALCQALFPGTNPTDLHQSTIYIVCDADRTFRDYGDDSVAAAIKTRATEAVNAAKATAQAALVIDPTDAAALAANAAADAAIAERAAAAAADPIREDPAVLTLTATITKEISIAGAIAGLAYAIGIIGINPIKATMIQHAKESLMALDYLFDTASGTKASKVTETLKKEIRDLHMYNIIGLIYIVPIIMAHANHLYNTAAAAGAAAVTAGATAADAAVVAVNTITSTAGNYINAVQTAIAGAIPAAAANLLMPAAGVSKEFADGLPHTEFLAAREHKFFKGAFVTENSMQLILSATQLIINTILEIATAPMAAMVAPVAAPVAVSQIIAVITAVTTSAANRHNIGPFVKEISTPQRSADSARTNPKPSTIPGDVYPIIYEFVGQDRQAARPISGAAAAAHNPFPEPAGGLLPAANRFYSDSNLFTHGRYEIRYERHNWSPVTGLGFKFVVGDIQPAVPNQRYEIEFGMKLAAGGANKSFITTGPSAALLAACCLDRVLHPNPPAALPVAHQALKDAVDAATAAATAAAAPAAPAAAAAQAAAATAALQQRMSYDNINQSINHLLIDGGRRTAIQGLIQPPLSTQGTPDSFADIINMFHPYLHFKGNTPGPTDQFHQLPPELWFDIKRGGDRDQVMAAYRLSLLLENGNPKYPYLVFVTGDQLCAAIAVKKGLATIFQTNTGLRYWSKGIVYQAPADIPGQFIHQISKVVPLWQMYDLTPANLPVNVRAQPQPQQYSIQLWGGNQMKGGDFTTTTYDNIEDGYGTKYTIPKLQVLLLPLQPQLLYNLIERQRLQEIFQRRLQQLQQQYYLLKQETQQPQQVEQLQQITTGMRELQAGYQQQLNQLQPLTADQLQQFKQQHEQFQHLQQQLQQLQPEYVEQLKQLQPEQLQQLHPQQLQQLQQLQQFQQLQQQLQQLKELDSDQLQELQNYAFIHNTPETENLQKLLLMNFGSGVEIGKILFAMAALPDSEIVCTRDTLIAGLNRYRIIEYATDQIKNDIHTIVQNSPNATVAQQRIFTFVRTPAYLAAAQAAAQAPAQAPAQAQVIPQWVNDMFTILNFTAIPNISEPAILIRDPDEEPTPAEQRDVQYSLSNYRAEFIRARSYTPVDAQAAAQAPAHAARAEAHAEARQDALNDARVRPRTRVEEQAQAAAQAAAAAEQPAGSKKRGRREGGQQLDSIDKLTKGVKRSIFKYINEEYRGNQMDDTPDNPISKYINETWDIYKSLNTIPSVISYFNTFCSMMRLNRANSTPTQPEDDMEPVAKTPAPVGNVAQPEVDMEPVVETPAPVAPVAPAAPVALNTKPKQYTLTAPPQTDKKGIHTIFNSPTFFTRLQRTNLPKANPSNANQTNFTPLSSRPQGQTQRQIVKAARTGVRTGGKRRTHKKCHTKKTRRTQKNHKRKRHGTQRKRSHRQRV